jgi:hypothetical protein
LEPVLGRPIEDVRDLVARIAALERAGAGVVVYPDADERIHDRLRGVHLAGSPAGCAGARRTTRYAPVCSTASCGPIRWRGSPSLSRPAAPSSPRRSDELDRERRLASASGELLGAAFKLLGELVLDPHDESMAERVGAEIRRGLEACVAEVGGRPADPHRRASRPGQPRRGGGVSGPATRGGGAVQAPEGAPEPLASIS